MGGNSVTQKKGSKVTDRSILHAYILHLSTYEKTQLLQFLLKKKNLYLQAVDKVLMHKYG